jgi:hypothetical protein
MPAQLAVIRISVGARIFVVAATIFVAAAGVSLFFLSEQTHLYFAWTIKPPLTAAFLGAGYLTVTTALAIGLLEHEWARIRVGVWVVATGLILILIATLLHLDRFHLRSPVWSAQAWAWTWLFLYIALVPGLIVALWQQRRMSGAELPAASGLGGWLKWCMRLLGVLMLAIGGSLFIAPAATAPLWPWALTPLTARMVGAFYAAFAVSLFATVKENDYRRIHTAAGAYIVFALLQFVNILRYPDVNWEQPRGWLLAFVYFALLIVGSAGIRGYFTAVSASR